MAACEAEISSSIAAFGAAGAVYEEPDRVPLGESALDSKCGGWMRVRDIYGSDTTLCGDAFDPQTLAQGSIGDCYLVAAIAAVACVPGFISSLFVNHESNEAGVYGVRLWNHTTGWWELMWLDDAFPVAKGTYRDLKTDVSYRITGRDAGGPPPSGYGYSPMFMALKSSEISLQASDAAATAGRRFSFWPMLLEVRLAVESTVQLCTCCLA